MKRNEVGELLVAQQVAAAQEVGAAFVPHRQHRIARTLQGGEITSESTSKKKKKKNKNKKTKSKTKKQTRKEDIGTRD
jgi:hypothetical protein